MSEQTRPVRAAVLGLGFMGRTHAGAYRAAGREGVRVLLTAVADSDPERLRATPGPAGNLAPGEAGAPVFDPAATRVCRSAEELLAEDDVDLVSVCTPTDSHVALAAAALEAGRHVLVEKPVALDPRDIRRLAEAARRAGRLAMPAMCMRFWPGWSWLKEAVDDGRFGPVRAARFERVGAPPAWSPFYRDVARSGGALFDLHIHDVDFIVHCFGLPASVTTTGDVSHHTTLYRFEHGPAQVTATGGWLSSDVFPFRMRYLVEFEGAVADFDFGREPRLLVHHGARAETIGLSGLRGYDVQIRALVDAIRAGRDRPPATIEEAAVVADVLQAELASLRNGAPREL